MPKGSGVLKRYSPLVFVAARTLDVALCIAGGLLAYALRFGFTAPPTPLEYAELTFVGVLLILVIFPLCRVYQSWRSARLWLPVVRVLAAWLIVFAVLLIFLVAVKQAELFSRGWLAIWFGCTAGLMSVLRLTTYATLKKLRRRGYNLRHVVIVGDRAQAWELVRAVHHTVWSGFVVDRVFSTSGAGVLEGVEKAPLSTLGVWVESHPPDEVWIALPLEQNAALHEALEQVRLCAANVRYAPDFFGLFLLNRGVTEILSVPMLDLSASPLEGGNRLIKDLEDRLLAAGILVFISPLMLLLAAGVKLSSRGPVLFRQERHGWDGRKFWIYKFRTMQVHNEVHGVVTQAKVGDLRITGYGKFLRRTSLDELPQLINIFKGEMSIVGPRPHAVEHNDQYKKLIDHYMLRHKVKPGLTGWAQVNGWRGETDSIVKMQQRVEHDLYYIEHWSLWFDLKIIFLTVFKGFVNKNAY